MPDTLTGLEQQIANTKKQRDEVATRLKEQIALVSAAKELRQQADNAFSAYIPNLEKRLKDHINGMEHFETERELYKNTHLGNIREQLPIGDLADQTLIDNKATNGYLKDQMLVLKINRNSNKAKLSEYFRIDSENPQFREYFDIAKNERTEEGTKKRNQIMKGFRVQYQNEVAKMGKMQRALNEHLTLLKNSMDDRIIDEPVPPSSYRDVVAIYKEKYPDYYAGIKESYEQLQALKERGYAAKTEPEMSAINDQIASLCSEDPLLEFYTQEEYELNKILRQYELQATRQGQPLDELNAAHRRLNEELSHLNSRLAKTQHELGGELEQSNETGESHSNKNRPAKPSNSPVGSSGKNPRNRGANKDGLRSLQNGSPLEEAAEPPLTSSEIVSKLPPITSVVNRSPRRHPLAEINTTQLSDLETPEASQDKSLIGKTHTQPKRARRERGDFDNHQNAESIEDTTITNREPRAPLGAPNRSTQRNRAADDLDLESRQAGGAAAADDNEENSMPRVDAKKAEAMLDVKKAMEGYVHKGLSEVFNFSGGRLLRDDDSNRKRREFLSNLEYHKQMGELDAGVDLSQIDAPLRKLKEFEFELRSTDRLNLDKKADRAEIFSFKQLVNGRSLVDAPQEKNKLFDDYYAKKAQTPNQTFDELKPTGVPAIAQNIAAQKENYRNIGAHENSGRLQPINVQNTSVNAGLTGGAGRFQLNPAPTTNPLLYRPSSTHPQRNLASRIDLDSAPPTNPHRGPPTDPNRAIPENMSKSHKERLEDLKKSGDKKSVEEVATSALTATDSEEVKYR